MTTTLDYFEEFIREEHDRPGFEMPKHKIVCTNCHGKGTEGPGFVYTEADRYEMGDEFYEHMDDLRAGVYDKVCSRCKGQNVIDEVDEHQLDPEIKKLWHQWLTDESEMADIQRMERMMGA